MKIVFGGIGNSIATVALPMLSKVAQAALDTADWVAVAIARITGSEQKSVTTNRNLTSLSEQRAKMEAQLAKANPESVFYDKLSKSIDEIKAKEKDLFRQREIAQQNEDKSRTVALSGKPGEGPSSASGAGVKTPKASKATKETDPTSTPEYKEAMSVAVARADLRKKEYDGINKFLLDTQIAEQNANKKKVEDYAKSIVEMTKLGNDEARRVGSVGQKLTDEASFQGRTKGMGTIDKETTKQLDENARAAERSRQAVIAKATEDNIRFEDYKAQLEQINAAERNTTETLIVEGERRKVAQGDWLGGLATGVQTWAESVGNISKQMEGFGERTFDKMGDALAEFVTTGKLNFKDLARSIIADLGKMIAKQLMFNMLKSALGGTSFGALFGFANGGAFEGGVQKFANGGVVTSPTMFGMAGGKTGLMGEAGPEAIMPLTRGPNGKLGVAASGGGNSGINIGSISVVVQGGNTNEETGAAMQKKLVETMKQIADGRIANAKRPGGLAYGV